MRKYETIFISDPDLKDQVRLELFDKVREIITKENGIIIDFDDWGNKKLAYEIRKKARGHYVCVTYGGSGDLVTELERNFRLSEMVMKFMTIVISEDMTVQEIEAEAQKAQETAQTEVETASEESAETEEESSEETTADTEDSSPEEETTEETSN
jgi:small subunit ribosomal protein S6